MSLQKLAKHLEATGRNNDSMLVHMSPREVSGLQALARQHGGDLSINPTTGLVEAGFLDSILPMLAGAALTATGVGAPLAAALVGGGTGLATGSVEKGLMAGLGAYGGAGLGSSLSGAGAAAAPASTAATVTPNAAAIPGVTSNATNAAMNSQNILAPNALQGTSPLVGNVTTPAATNTLGSGFYNTVPNETLTASFTPDKMLADAAKGTTTIPSQAIPVPPANTFGANLDRMGTGFGDVTSSMDKFGDFASQNKGNLLMSAAPLAYSMTNPNSSLFSKDKPNLGPQKTKSTQRPYEFSTEQNLAAYSPGESTAEQTYFDEPRFTALPTYTAREGGLMGYAVGGPVEQMSAENAMGGNMMYPQSQLKTDMYSNPMMQRPMPSNVIGSGMDAPTNPYTGEARMAQGGIADYNGYSSGGGLKSYNLGDYSDGGRLLKGPGDGVSDSIPASIGDRQPARLADGEFVVPARIVSELGNGSTDAGARKLYEMMDRVQKQRNKTTGKGKVAVNSKADKYMPA
jgi:hypothetical protein